MPDPALIERVRTLRERGSSPKEIARALKLPPATVTPLIRALAAERPLTAQAPAIAGCWVSAGWAAGLRVHDHPEWPDSDAPGDLGREGLVTVLVAADRSGSKVSVCGYLVDVYCLGVKDALGPHSLDRFRRPPR